MTIGKDALLGAQRYEETVFINALGDSVVIRSMSGAAMDKLIPKLSDGADDNFVNIARMAVECLYTEDGGPLFTKSDIPKILELSTAALNEIGKEMLRVNGVSQEGVDEIETELGKTTAE